jgi:hypothetical protein
MDPDQGYWIRFKRILYLKIRGLDLLVKEKGDPLVLAPMWCLAWEGRSEFYELSYWIWVCGKVLKYDSGSEFYELCYWIQFCSKVLKYPTG